MRKLLFFLWIPFVLTAQKNVSKSFDSLGYYFEQIQFNKKANNYRNCLYYSKKAIDFSQKKNDEKALADSYYNLGLVYFDLRKHDDAIDSFVRSIAIYSTLPNSTEQAMCYYYLGMAYIEQGNTTLAEKNLNQAESLFDKLKIHSAIEMINLQRAIIYKQLGRSNQAVGMLEKIITQSDTIHSRKVIPEALYHLGMIEKERKRFNLALNYMNRALSSTKNQPELQSKILLALSQIHEKNANIDASHGFLKRYVELKDSIDKQFHAKIEPVDFDSFKNAEKIKHAEQLEREKESQLKAKNFAKLISILAIALISILSLLSLSLYKNNILRNESNKLLQEKNRELELAKEKAENATKARSEFLSTVSHELRTPLNAINGITHLLIEEAPKPSQIEYLNSLKFSGNYLLTFINDILEINRIESENVPVELINCTIRTHLKNIQNSFREIAQENHNVFEIEIDNAIPENLLCDPTKLSQIIINLVNNALKFTKNGHVRLIAKLEEVQDKNIRINFQVSDNGIGIPEDKQSEIFESFSQGSIEINRKYGGTGLGLAIVKRLVELLGGAISLNSKVGLGTTFTFTLPFQVGENEVVAVPVEIPEKELDDSMVQGKRILLVEDNKINQMITKKMLENRGMNCRILDNGEDCVTLVRKEAQNYDLVLMDVHLPGINGTIATQQIREFNTTIPIIALTAISLNENREMLLSYGMTDVLTKPFEPEKFYKILSDHLL
ncbi:MAG: Sensor histidine kinase RcsC [Bacteroidota bacterium]|jgi:signal transduction histidine kinase/CheY-like chemotaxis protein